MYCQSFMGEKEPFNQFNLSHGICNSCQKIGRKNLEAKFDDILQLKNFSESLYEAGEKGEVNAADALVNLGLANGVRALDLLMGFVAPMLYDVGNKWENGGLTVAEEHNFTSVCEAIINVIELKQLQQQNVVQDQNPMVLLANIEGNHHYLGIRIVSLWLHSLNISNYVLFPSVPIDKIYNLVLELRPKILGISLSMSDQFQAIQRLHTKIQIIPEAQRPQIIVGGFPIKANLIPLISMNGLAYVKQISDFEMHLNQSSEQSLKFD